MEIALKGDFVGDLRSNGAFSTREEGLVLDVFVRSDWLCLDELGSSIGLASKIR